MNHAAALAALPNPWRAAWLRLMRRRRAPPPAEPDYRDLAALSESTLRDIGAPEWVCARAGRGVAPWELERARGWMARGP